MAGAPGPREQKGGWGLRLAPERVGSPHRPTQSCLPGPNPGSQKGGTGATCSSIHLTRQSPESSCTWGWRGGTPVPENRVHGRRRPPGASKAVRQPSVQELGTRGHESPHRLGGRTLPVPSSSHT